jgi:hypothetical protein
MPSVMEFDRLFAEIRPCIIGRHAAYLPIRSDRSQGRTLNYHPNQYLRQYTSATVFFIF